MLARTSIRLRSSLSSTTLTGGGGSCSGVSRGPGTMVDTLVLLRPTAACSTVCTAWAAQGRTGLHRAPRQAEDSRDNVCELTAVLCSSSTSTVQH